MWKYKTTDLRSSDNWEEKLNELGKDGWELITAFPYSVAGPTQFFFKASVTSGYTFLFKKKV